MANRLLLPLAACLLAAPALAAPPAPQPLDPELAVPYRWRVVVAFHPGSLFTPQFRQDILHEITAALQPPLGEVGRVEVIDLASVPEDKRDPLCQEFLKSGWPALDLPAFRDLTGVKTHFLKVTAARGGYRLEARQHDGSTGLASPLVRTKEAATPDTVGRLAGLMLARDFGPVGTAEKLDKEPDAVRVRFRGGALPGFDRFVRPGDVFAVSVIREQTRKDPNAAPEPSGPKNRFREKSEPTVTVRVGQPREFTLLRLEGELSEGVGRCRVLTRFRDPLPYARGVVGFRCLKLATVEGPVQLRVIDPDGNPQFGGNELQVRATDSDFTGTDARDALELRNGLFRSPRPLKNVACVVIGLGSDRQERFPVPILGDGPVTLRFEARPEMIAKAAFERACQEFRGRVAEARTSQVELIRALSRLIVQGKNKDALERATSGLDNLDAADKELTAELGKLKGEPGAKDPLATALLESAEEQLAAIRQGRGGIAQRAEELKAAVAKQDDPVRFEREFRAKELTSRISSLIAQGEVPEALAAYDELFEATQDPDVKARKAKLAAEWEPKNDEHRKAREYVTGEWRSVTGLAGFKLAVDRLTEAAEVLAKTNDRLGLRNLLSSFEPAYARLKEVLDTLDPNAESDRGSVKEVQTVLQALQKVQETARESLKRIEGK